MFKNSVYILKKNIYIYLSIILKKKKKFELICIHYTGMYHNIVFRKTHNTHVYYICHNHGDRVRKKKPV